MLTDLLFDYVFKKTFSFRSDGSPFLDYPSPVIFNIDQEPFSFYSNKWKLFSHIYFDKKYRGSYKAKVIFFHGLGAGHTAYSYEIAQIAKQGFLVYCFDYTGCMESEGETIISLANATLDMDAFFLYLQENDTYPNLPFYSIGHSWGGFLSFLSLDKKYNVSKAISLAGFPSLSFIFSSSSSFAKKHENGIRKYLQKRYGDLAIKDSFLLASSSNKPYMYIQGDKDETVPFNLTFPYMEKLSKGNKNASILVSRDRGHQPYWSVSTYKYFLSLINEGKILSPTHSSKIEFDYSYFKNDDMDVLKAMFDFLYK